MPYDIRIIQGRDIVRLDAHGHADMEATRQLTIDAIWACVHSKIGRVLLDVRDMDVTDLTLAQLSALAHASRQIAPPPDAHKIAVLNRPPDTLDRAATLAAEAQQERWNIRTFRDFEAALLWLVE